MGRCCAQCKIFLPNSNFTSNQWRKGEGCSPCRDRIASPEDHRIILPTGYAVEYQSHHTTGYAVEYQPPPAYICGECSRNFNTQNQLNMHMQVHRPRNVACPVCGDTRFRSPANAVQHVESGYYIGQDNARQQIYQYAQRQGGMQQYMGLMPLLTHGGGNNGVPDLPYRCPYCVNKSFRDLGQLMQHSEQKHNNMRMLGYWFFQVKTNIYTLIKRDECGDVQLDALELILVLIGNGQLFYGFI